MTFAVETALLNNLINYLISLRSIMFQALCFQISE